MRLTWTPNAALFSLLLAILLLSGTRSEALPAYLLRFAQDPFSRPEFRNQCSTCHVNPQGGGPRNPFGEAFDKNDHVVTPEFRQAWPDHFFPSVSPEPVPTPQGEVKATFLSNEQDTILEINGEYYRMTPKQARLEKIEAEEAARLLAAPPPPPPAPAEPKLPLRDQPTFDHYLVNLPTTLPYDRGQFSMRFTHRFTPPVLGCDPQTERGVCVGIGDLYGFDGFSYSSLGASYGFTNWLAGTVYRSPFDKTIELGAVVQFLRQGDGRPFSSSFRASVEGRDNFQETFATSLVFPLSRAFATVAEVFAVPMFTFHANRPISFPTFAPLPEGETRRHLATAGLGASIRFRPRTAFVLEWMPRVGGFRAFDSRNVYSFGLQRTTNAHVFELVLTNSVTTTTGRMATTGAKYFSLGFNLYRRLR